MDQLKHGPFSVQPSSRTVIMTTTKKKLRHIVENVMAALDKRTARGLDESSGSSGENSDSSQAEKTKDTPVQLELTRPPPNYPAENDGPNLILGHTQSKLDMKCVENWLILAEDGKLYTEKLMTEPPVKPKGGQILLYKCNRFKDLDHHRDQYTGFRNYGSNKMKVQPILTNTYYKYFRMYDEDGNKKNFEKATYERKCSASKLDKVILIHYFGDESEFDERCHGNSKTGRNYTASTKTGLLEIGREVNETGKGSQIVYEKLIKKAAQRSDFKDRESVIGPRDRKQVENVKQDMEGKSRLLRCDIFSVIEMGRNKTLGRFIMRHVVNPYDLIVMAEPAGLRFAENLLNSAKADPDLPQYLCYDTTFNLGDAYVSVLVMRNTYIVDNPLFPLAYLVHERKLEAVHREFFREMCDSIGLDDLASNVPVVFDRKRGISNAVQAILPQIKYIFCSNHIIRDVKYWVKKAGGKQDDLKVLKGHVRHMLECDSAEEFDEYYRNVSPMWSQGFKDYFMNELLDDLAARLYTKQFAAFKGKCATNNLSKSFNFMIKNRYDWKELRVDSLIMSLFNLQLSLLQEFERAFNPAGIGRYVLKPQYKNFKCPVEIPNYITWPESKFLATFKEGIYKPQSNIEKEKNYMQSRSSLAKLTCEQNLVSLDSRAGVFVVTGIYNGKRVVVDRKDNGLLECSCKSTGYCYHKLAVLYSLKVDVSEDKDSYSLSILRKKGRGGKRTGRKGQNVDDFLNNVQPAPDSDLAKKRSHSQNTGGQSSDNENEPEAFVVSSPESSNEEVMVTSVGQRSDDDDSFQAIHHYESTQFVEPNDQLVIPRTSITGSRSLTLDVDMPECILLSGTPDTLPRIWTQNSTYQCLEPKRWLAEDIVNDMSRLFIQSLQLTEAVALLNTHEFNVVRSGSMSKYVTEALRCQGINSDVLLINICMNSHFLFGVVLYRQKKIVIVDSKKGLIGAADIYKPLLLIVAATYFVGFVQFEPADWEIVTETELAKQPNGFDCGVFAIYNQYEMLRGQPFPKDPPASERLRKWILYCLHSKEAKGSLLIPRGKKVKRLIPKHRSQVEDLLESLRIPDAALICKTGSCATQIGEELKICKRGWGACAHNGCKANFSDINYIMCTYCRDWYHLGPCIPQEEAQEDYFLCVQCRMYRISF